MTELAPRWLRTLRAVGGRGDVAHAGAQLLARWAEPHRRYHGLAHLTAVLARIDELAAYATDVEVVRLAAWFHDAVYDPTASDNEERSAVLAVTVLGGLRVDSASVAEVARLVLLTAAHAPGAEDRDGAVLCDADLAVLASAPPDYARYVAAVREEYAHLDDATFAAGRAAVLRSLLDRPSLFTTAHGRTSWEATARDNIVRELGGRATS